MSVRPPPCSSTETRALRRSVARAASRNRSAVPVTPARLTYSGSRPTLPSATLMPSVRSPSQALKSTKAPNSSAHAGGRDDPQRHEAHDGVAAILHAAPAAATDPPRRCRARSGSRDRRSGESRRAARARARRGDSVLRSRARDRHAAARASRDTAAASLDHAIQDLEELLAARRTRDGMSRAATARPSRSARPTAC